MNIDRIVISKGFAALAPMAGVADRAFRELCTRYGAAYVVSEMVSSKGVSMHDRKSTQLMYVSPAERPAAIQIFGDDPGTMAAAAVKALSYKPDFIDINMGCPAPKIAGNGGGSALMKDPLLVQKIVSACVRAVDVPVTVKIRSGWDEDNINAVEVAKRAEAAGAAAITVHGRTRRQMYAPPVNYDIIKEVKQAVSVPVIGNGDIVDGESARHMYDYTGCDFIMVGRGALGRPWVFEQINAFLSEGVLLPEPPIRECMNVMLEHIRSICEYKGEFIGIREARKHAAWYIKGIRGAASYRQEIGAIESIGQLEALVDTIVSRAENI